MVTKWEKMLGDMDGTVMLTPRIVFLPFLVLLISTFGYCFTNTHVFLYKMFSCFPLLADSFYFSIVHCSFFTSCFLLHSRRVLDLDGWDANVSW